MELKELQDLAVLQVNNLPSVKLYLDKIRKNLVTLLCQTEVVESSGSIEAFVGDKDMAKNIGKAIFALLCVGAKMEIDVLKEIDSLSSELSKKLKPKSDSAAPDKKQQKTESAEPARESQKNSQTVPKTEEKKYTPQGNKGDKSSDEHLKLIENFKNSFQHAKSASDVNKTWKEVVGSALSGKDKANLQQVKNEALKRVAT